MSSLTELANTTAGGKFWQLQKAEEAECSQCWWRYRPSSEAVDTTAYIVMSHVLRSDPGLAVESVKWLGRKRNSQGRLDQNLDITVERKRSERVSESQ